MNSLAASDLVATGRLAVDALVDCGVDTVFGIPASHVIELYDGLAQTDRIRTIVARNEQNAIYMADGYARRTRRPGIVAVTGGPGLANVVTGLQVAWADSAPVVVIASDLGAADRGRAPLGIPHETFDSATMAAATGATVIRADEPRDVYPAVCCAVAGASRARHRPSVCLLSRSALEGAASSSSPPTAARPPAAPDDEAVHAIAAELAAASNPVILAGAGVVWAQAEPLLAELVARSGIPCLTTIPGRSSIDDRTAGWAGVVDNDATRRKLHDADVVLALGSSFGWTTTHAWQLTLQGRLLHVDVDSSELGRHYEPAIGVAADARAFLERLLTCPELEGGFRRIPDARPVQGHPWIDALERALPTTDVTVACDVTMALRWIARALHLSPSRRLLLPWNSMGMGWSYGAALGAQAGCDDAVLAVMGDGGALFSIGELATAVDEHLPVGLLVFNNHLYGTIAELQDSVCGGRRFGVDLTSPNFAAVGRAFGMHTARAETPRELENEVTRWLDRREPALIEASIQFADFA